MNDTERVPMLNFNSPPVRPAPPAEAPRLRETVRVHPAGERTSYLLKDPADWDWQDLQAYVATRIIEIHGPFPRDDRKECGIFKSFVARHGKMAGPIAKFAFEVVGGEWMGAPIQVTRFCKGSDPYFSDPIKIRLGQR